MLTAFWSTHHGQACTTANTAALACMASIQGRSRLLAAHTQARRGALERCLLPEREWKEKATGDFANHGMDALVRLARNGRLMDAMVPDYACSILHGNRLDLMPGTDKAAQPDADRASQRLDILRAASASYDRVLTDVHSGYGNPGSQPILEQADIRFLCLNQNRDLLDACFADAGVQRLLSLPSTYCLVSRYDPDIGLSAADIARRYGLARSRVFPIPYSAGFARACNDGTLYAFVARHGRQAGSPEKAFMTALAHAAECLQEGGKVCG